MKDDNKKPAEQRENRLAQQRQRRQQETEKRLQLKWNDSEAVNKNMSYDEPRAVYFFSPFLPFLSVFLFSFFFQFRKF